MLDFEKRLLDEFQRDLPLTSRPFAMIAERLGVDEQTVVDTLSRFRAEGLIARVGAVVPPNRIGASTLAAMAVSDDRLQSVADLVSAYPEVNHNYEREHRLNLWFVVAAPDRDRIDVVLGEIAERTGLRVLDLPMVESFHLDLGFPLRWN
jgi:siroheme decarboxylase